MKQLLLQHPPRQAPKASGLIPRDDLDLTLLGRRPPRLQEATERAVAAAPIPSGFDCCGASPAASIVVVSYDNLVLTKLCVAAVLAAQDETSFELIVVDNHSTDGTVDYLGELERHNRGVRVVLNDTNRGFAAANNAGLATAAGRILVLLNNDTVPPPGWVTRLARHLAEPAVGLVGPTTNRIGNEAEVAAPYRTYGEMVRFADGRGRRYDGKRADIPVPCMFCLAMRREAFERIGPLDERFEVGMLEDDDYARRARDAGYQLVCAEDAFVHHFGQGSFGKLVASGDYMRLLQANQRRYEEKWGERWRPYARRPSEQYDELVRRVRKAVSQVVPPGATVAVVSRGDDQLLSLDGRRSWHFPRGDDGTYAGYYPATGTEAVDLLVAVRRAGAEFIVFPEPSLWWLDHYPELTRHMSSHGTIAARRPGVCAIYDLRETPGSAGGPPCE